MGKTMAEKLLARAAGKAEVSAGDIIWANVDCAMMDDILGPRVEIAEGMEKLGGKIWDADKVVVISDHYTPPASVRQAEIVKFTREWARDHGVENYYEFKGPCHQIMAENGHILPGSLVLGTDSHTCMGGALGAFASGVGSTEMLGILLTGQTWLRVPDSILVNWSGKLQNGVMAKDVSLYTIGDIGHAGATYKAVEYSGDTIVAMCMDERFAITNMAVEMGAKVGLMATDKKTVEYLGGQTGKPVHSDADAVYLEKRDYDASKLEPMLACPHQVDNVEPVVARKGVRIDQAYLGSCTGGRYSDLLAACEILKSRHIAHGVRLLVSPASKSIWERAERNGLLRVLSCAGATILAPTCGVCVGLHSGLLAAGETCISSSNRNFQGRMGSKDASIYLASPRTVAASALRGAIADPREVL